MHVQVEADYDSQLSIYAGNDCGNLLCVNGNDDNTVADGSASSNLGVFMESDATYRILVHGFNGDEGEFSLTLDAVDIAVNDQCSEAIELDLVSLQLGSTIYALVDEGVDVCEG